MDRFHAVFVNHFDWILNARVILRGKDYGCGKFLWKDTRKESFMFWLRNWSYLITSSSSTTLLLDILIFHSDVSQSLFCLIICCIQQFHCLMMLSNNFVCFKVDFFFNSKTEKKFPVQGKKITVFLVRALTSSQKFSCLGKNFRSGLRPSLFERKKLPIWENKFASREPP